MILVANFMLTAYKLKHKLYFPFMRIFSCSKSLKSEIIIIVRPRRSNYWHIIICNKSATRVFLLNCSWFLTTLVINHYTHPTGVCRITTHDYLLVVTYVLPLSHALLGLNSICCALIATF